MWASLVGSREPIVRRPLPPVPTTNSRMPAGVDPARGARRGGGGCGATEVREVGGGTRGLVLVVAGHRPHAIPERSPARAEAGRELLRGARFVGPVAQRRGRAPRPGPRRRRALARP